MKRMGGSDFQRFGFNDFGTWVNVILAMVFGNGDKLTLSVSGVQL